MKVEEITEFLSYAKAKKQNNVLKILFKKRTTVEGIIIREKDYEELKGKNFWRIIFLKDLPAWETTKNISISKIFNGHDFKKLAYATL